MLKFKKSNIAKFPLSSKNVICSVNNFQRKYVFKWNYYILTEFLLLHVVAMDLIK